MKHVLKLVLAGAAMVAVGCSNNKKPAVNASAMDIRSNDPAPAPVVVQPVQPVQPVQAVQPVVSDAPPVASSTSVASVTPAMAGGTYTIQKGDTLFKIARAKYGDPSAVNKIKAANPGLDANHIKVGQKIKLP